MQPRLMVRWAQMRTDLYVRRCVLVRAVSRVIGWLRDRVVSRLRFAAVCLLLITAIWWGARSRPPAGLQPHEAPKTESTGAPAAGGNRGSAGKPGSGVKPAPTGARPGPNVPSTPAARRPAPTGWRGAIASVGEYTGPAALVILILLIIDQLVQASKRLYVEEFMDYTVAPPAASTRGIARMLTESLSHIGTLYQVIDERRAISMTVDVGRPIDTTISIDDLGAALKETIPANVPLRIGPISIPIAPIIALVSRVSRGPTLGGSIHKNDDGLLVIGRFNGRRNNISWRVTQSIDPTADPPTLRPLQDMIDELTYRVFTDLSLKGSARWSAMKALCDGLRSYRDSLWSPGDRYQKLIDAEKCLSAAITEDGTFDLAVFNLGVVYADLRRTDEAFITFERASRLNPSRWQAHYAMAQLRYDMVEACEDLSRLEDCIRHCSQVIDMHPGSIALAKAYDLKGLAHRRVVELAVTENCAEPTSPVAEPGTRDAMSAPPDAYDRRIRLLKAVGCGRKAAHFAWKALCLAERRGCGVRADGQAAMEAIEKVASVCIRNLASSHRWLADLCQETPEQSWAAEQPAPKEEPAGERDAAPPRRDVPERNTENAKLLTERTCSLVESVCLLRQARRLEPTDYAVYSELAMSLQRLGDHKKTIALLEKGIGITGASIEYWTALASTYAHEHQRLSQKRRLGGRRTLETSEFRKRQALDACGHALCGPSMLADRKDLRDRLSEAYVRCGKPEQRAWIEQIDEMEAEAKKMSEMTVNEAKRAYDKRFNKVSSQSVWPAGYLGIALGKRYFEEKEYPLATECFTHSLDALRSKHPEEVQRMELRLWLLRSLIKEARENPKRFGEAIDMADAALKLNPDSAEVKYEVGMLYNELAQYDKARRYWDAVYQIDQAQPELCFKIGKSYAPPTLETRDADRRKRLVTSAIRYLQRSIELAKGKNVGGLASMHYWLAKSFYERGDYEQSIESVKTARILDPGRLGYDAFLAHLYLRAKLYDRCASTCAWIIDQVENKLAGKGPAEMLKALGENAAPGSAKERPLEIVYAFAFVYQATCLAWCDSADGRAMEILKNAEGVSSVLAVESVAPRLRSENVLCSPNAAMMLLATQRRTGPVPSGARSDLLADYYACLGWVQFRANKPQIDDAITSLNLSLFFEQDAHTHLLLARIYESRTGTESGNSAFQVLERARDHCAHATTLDMRQEYTVEVNALRTRLDEIEKRLNSAATSADRDAKLTQLMGGLESKPLPMAVLTR